ncbi:MAG TPA: glycosyltransferase [Acidimicrobiales bacterium]|nr:glycosyltransferase [Acidimicrobiales bacterium]
MDADLCLVLPAYDEEQRLPVALERLARFSSESGLAVEVIVADDGSRDATVAVAEQWTASNPSDTFQVRVIGIRHRGKGAAVRAGLKGAHAPVVGYSDVDLSAGTDSLTDMYREIKDGADMAIASRGMAESILDVRQPWYRERAGRIYNVLLRRLLDIPFRDTQCGLKLFRSEVAAQVLRHQRLDGFAFDAELVVLAARLGYDVKEVPVRWSHAEGSKVSMVRDSVAMSRDIFRIARRLRSGQIHALGIPTADALDVMASSEANHWWYVAKRLVITQAWPRSDPASPDPASPVGSPVGRCLDVGCGGGAVLNQAHALMPAFGVDLSARALQHGRAIGLSTLVQAEAGALPFATGSFSVALALDVLEHHPHPDQLLAEIRRVLAPDGTLIVTVPAFQWMWSYADHVLGHYRRYTSPQLAAELVDGRFTVERLTYFHSWLLPVAWTFRKVRALVGSTESADDFAVPALVNRVLLWVSRVELRVLARRNVPFGLSVLAVARPSVDTGSPSANGAAAVRRATAAPATL